VLFARLADSGDRCGLQKTSTFGRNPMGPGIASCGHDCSALTALPMQITLAGAAPGCTTAPTPPDTSSVFRIDQLTR
jgi:hypothetical protein